jgi:AP2-associated kinase
MRRGRPKQSTYADPVPATKPPESDPFAALDSKSYETRAAAVDELSQKFPSLDTFSILHDQGKNFQFTSTSNTPPVATNAANDSLKKRVVEALADEVFARPTMTHTGPASGSSTSTPKVNPRLEREKQPATRSHPTLTEPNAIKSAMVSTGVQTSPLPSPSLQPIDVAKRPIWRVPRSRSPNEIPTRSHQGSSPQPMQSELPPRPEPTNSRRYFLERTRTKSQTALSLPKASVSSRPSLEGQRPSMEQLEPVEKSRSSSARPRPSSVYVESNIELLRDQDGSRPRRTSSTTPKLDGSGFEGISNDASSDEEGPDDHITSDVDFLKSIESSEDTSKKGNRRRSSSGTKTKRTSIPTISLSGTKNILAGKFGEAFRRFETNSSTTNPSHEHASEKEPLNLPASPLSPIMGSEATGTSGRSDDYDHDLYNTLEDSQALSPEVRRELERRRLSQEEKRVAAAAAEYRQRLERGDRAAAGPSKASSIQNRVRSLLDDSQGTQKVHKAPEGYGKYADTIGPGVPKQPPRVIGRKPVPSPTKSGIEVKANAGPSPTATSSAAAAAAAAQAAQRTGPRIAPKPLAFRAGQVSQTPTTSNVKDDEDWETNFSKKYPSLSGIEMVETEIAKGPVSRVRDV